MEVRGWDGDDELRGAIRCYNRAWKVGYRGVVPADVIEEVVRDDVEDAVEDLAARAESPSSFLIVAKKDDDVVGYVLARYAVEADFVASADAQLLELYVDPAHWREGVASELLDFLVLMLPGHLQGLVAEVIAENERAQAFFEARNFDLEDTGVLDVAGNLHGSAVYRRDLQAEKEARRQRANRD